MSDVENLKKTVSAMIKKDAKSILLGRDYLESLLKEIEAMEKEIDSLKENINKKPKTRVIGGGRF